MPAEAEEMGRHSSSVPHFFRGKCDNIDNAGLHTPGWARFRGIPVENYSNRYLNSFSTQFLEYCGTANELFRFSHILVWNHLPSFIGASGKLQVVVLIMNELNSDCISEQKFFDKKMISWIGSSLKLVYIESHLNSGGKKFVFNCNSELCNSN